MAFAVQYGSLPFTIIEQYVLCTVCCGIWYVCVGSSAAVGRVCHSLLLGAPCRYTPVSASTPGYFIKEAKMPFAQLLQLPTVVVNVTADYMILCTCAW